MKSPDKLIREQYFSKLDGISVSGVGNVPLYDIVPESDNELTTVYMKIGRQTYTETGSKSNFGGISTVELEIHQRFSRGATGGRKDIDLTADAVQIALLDSIANYIDLSPNFKCVVSTLQGDQDFENNSDTAGNITRTLTFQHIVYQN